MKKYFLSVFIVAPLIFSATTKGLSQNSRGFSLQEAVTYALENNYAIRNARYDYMILEKKVKEYVTAGLPQVSGNIKYNYNISIPTTLMPDFLTKAVVGINEGLFGLTPTHPVSYSEYMPVQFGTKHNASADIGISQLLYSRSFYVGLEANKKAAELTARSIQKSESDIRESVSRAYYIVLVSEENRQIVDSSLITLKKILNDTREFYRNGFVENTDVDQFELLVSNLETTKMTIDKKTELAYKLLKLQMGFPFDAPIVLTDKLENLFGPALEPPKENYDYTQTIDFKMLETQKKMAQINLRFEKSKYLPSVNSFLSFSENAMRNKFDFYDVSQKWYPTAIVGLQVSVPILNSGSKKYRVQEAKYSLEKMEITMEQVKQSLQIQEESARTDYDIALQTYQNRKKSLHIAQTIYYKTSVKYKEGVSSSFDLSQSYNQYMTSQTDYINSILILLNARQALEKIYTKFN